MRIKRNGNSKPIKKSKKTNYRSGLEEKVAKQLELNKISYEYESKNCKINYKIPSSNHIYTNDFRIVTYTSKIIYIEVKGIWDYADRYKHYLIKKQHPELDIRLVFGNAKNPIRRGSKTSYATICEGGGKGIFKGMKWKYSDKGIVPSSWFEE